MWLLALSSVPVAWLTGAGLVGTALVLADGTIGEVLAGCVTVPHALASGAHGDAVRTGLLMLAGIVGAGLVVLTTRLGRALGAARRRTRRHADAARLVGTLDEALGAVAVDLPDRLAYAVAGRPHTIVLSRATLGTLDDAPLVTSAAGAARSGRYRPARAGSGLRGRYRRRRRARTTSCPPR